MDLQTSTVTPSPSTVSTAPNDVSAPSSGSSPSTSRLKAAISSQTNSTTEVTTPNEFMNAVSTRRTSPSAKQPNSFTAPTQAASFAEMKASRNSRLKPAHRQHMDNPATLSNGDSGEATPTQSTSTTSFPSTPNYEAPESSPAPDQTIRTKDFARSPSPVQSAIATLPLAAELSSENRPGPVGYLTRDNMPSPPAPSSQNVPRIDYRGTWNKIANNETFGGTAAAYEGGRSEREGPPMTSAAFEQRWKSARGLEERRRILFSIDPANLPTLFGSRLEPDSLCDIVQAISAPDGDGDGAKGWMTKLELLEGLTRVQRFDMVKGFLDEGEKESLRVLFGRVRDEVERVRAAWEL
ncbi:hypothetical protein T439DRAFT_90602 [Meredithblackwellia eburnea MCA 4105]